MITSTDLVDSEPYTNLLLDFYFMFQSYLFLQFREEWYIKGSGKAQFNYLEYILLFYVTGNWVTGISPP